MVRIIHLYYVSDDSKVDQSLPVIPIIQEDCECGGYWSYNPPVRVRCTRCKCLYALCRQGAPAEVTSQFSDHRKFPQAADSFNAYTPKSSSEDNVLATGRKGKSLASFTIEHYTLHSIGVPVLLSAAGATIDFTDRLQIARGTSTWTD